MIRISRPGDRGHRFLRDILQHLVDCAIQLGIAIGQVIFRAVVDFDVGIDAVVFDGPAAGGAPPAELGLGGHAAVDERFIRANAGDPTPGARADQGAKFERAESVGEDVPIGPGMLVDQNTLVTRGAGGCS